MEKFEGYLRENISVHMLDCCETIDEARQLLEVDDGTDRQEVYILYGKPWQRN